MIGQGGGFFGSGAKSTDTTTNTQSTNTGAQIGDESFGFTFGGANIQTGGGKKSHSDVDLNTYNTVIQTDHGAFRDAVDFAQDALQLPGAALDAVVDTTAGALDAVVDAQDRSFEFSEELFGSSLDFAGSATSRALEGVLDAQDSAYSFSRGALEGALDASNDARGDVLDATRDAYDFSADSRDNAYDFSQYNANLFTNFARGIVDQSLESVASTVQRSQDSLGSTVTALNTIAREQSKSTDERLGEIVKYVIYGVVALGLGWALVAGSKS